MKCFYHSSDLDGHCSGAIVKYARPECELIGINHGDSFPWKTIKQNETVYMVDFCLQPFSDMIQLNKKCKLIWIDHHKSVIEDAHKEGFLAKEQRLEIGKGACELTWEHLSTHPMPLCVLLLSEYDVWKHTDPSTLPFQFGIRNYHTTPDSDGMDFWIDLFDPVGNISATSQIIEQGKIILHYLKLDNKKYIDDCGFTTKIDGLKCIAVNKMLTNSKIFDSVWDEKKYDAMLTFGYRKGRWTVSLYSTREDIDVSAIAKNRGGGGHKNAAGFQCNTLPFMLN